MRSTWLHDATARLNPAMAQLLDFATHPEKPKEWHIYTLKELLCHVAEEKPSERQYTKWLRGRKIFDRRFLAFSELFLGIEKVPGKPPELAEVARELLQAIERSKKRLEAEAEAQRKALEKSAGRDAPRQQLGRRAQHVPPPPPAPPPKSPDDELDEEKLLAEKPPEMIFADDEFLKALLERFLELHGYLSKFVLRELGDEFLAVSELLRRIGTSAYAGRRPSMPQFETWIKWLEWLGCLQKVGFRHRATPVGKEHGRYYKEIPDSELTLPGKHDELVLDPVAAVSAEPAPSGPALVPNAPSGRRTLEVDDDESESEEEDEEGGVLAAEEGLDLPPESAAPEPEPWAPKAEPYWANRPHDDAAAPRGRLPDEVIAVPEPPHSPEPEAPLPAEPEAEKKAEPKAPSDPPPSPREAGGGRRRGAEKKAEPPRADPPPVEAPPPRPAPPVPAPPPPLAPPPADLTRSGALARGAAYVLAWWNDSGRPGERIRARDARIDLERYSGSRRGLLVFKLLALASFLEAAPGRTAAVDFARELEGKKGLEALFLEPGALERVLESLGAMDPARPVSPFAERLVHVLRFRRALSNEVLLARLDSATEARELARMLRREVAGDALSTGIVFVVREMARAGHWRPSGVESLACVPWREVREAAHRLGLLGRAEAATFEDLLAASEALSRHFRESDEGEVPLLAFHAATASPFAFADEARPLP